MTEDTTTDDSDEQGEFEQRLDRLETQLAAQQETIEHQQTRIEEQAAIIEDQREQLDDDDEGDVLVNRRTALKAGGVLGLLGVGAGTASADPSGQIGTSSDPLNKLYTATLNGDSTGLTVNTGSSDRQILDLGTPTSGVDIRGTTGEAGGNVVAGHPANEVKNGASGVTISGGGAASIYNNIAGGNGAVVGGGARNDATGDLSTVAGGYNNSATALLATVLGGEENTADGNHSVAAGFKADANGKDGAFVVADGTSTAITAQNTDEVRFQAGGGFTIEDGDLNLSGNNLTDTTGGLTVKTFDNGNIELDPGSNNELQLSNQSTSSSGSLLAIEGSGNVVEASSKTLSDVGGIGSSISVDTISENTSDSDVTVQDTLDVTDGTIENSSGGLSVETGSGDLILNPSGNVDLNGNTLETSSGDLEVTTNDNGNLILDPGASSANTVKVKNRKSGSSSDNLLAVDSSDNLTESSKTVSDIGGGLEAPGGSSSGASTFDTWTEVSSTRPAFVTAAAAAETNGNITARVKLAVDESGGTNVDYSVTLTQTAGEHTAGTYHEGSASVLIPAGAQYQVENNSDPNNGNILKKVRESIL